MHDEPVEACPPSTVYRLKKFVRRHKTGVLATAAVGSGPDPGCRCGRRDKRTAQPRPRKLAEEQLQIATEQQRLAKEQAQLAQKQKRLAEEAAEREGKLRTEAEDATQEGRSCPQTG